MSHRRFSRLFFLAIVASHFFASGVLIMTSTLAPPSATPASQATPISECGIDTHQHLDGIYRSGGQIVNDYGAAAGTALTLMDDIGIQTCFIMPPPISADPDQLGTYDYTALTGVVNQNPGRFAFLGGGGTLNPVIHQAALAGEVTSEMRREFEEKANEIVRAGAAGFGEMAALHLSFTENHPFIVAPPDHPLFLLLADIAAREGMPIDLHMEAVSQDIPLPARFQSPPNPGILEENIGAFERLLSHNREAHIVWTHAGWDNTGQRTVVLMRDLLERHPNLYLSLKVFRDSVSETSPLQDGIVRPEWLALLQDFPDRFVMGADEFFGIPGLTPRRTPGTRPTWDLLDRLPEDVARKIACENALTIYRLEK